MFQYGFELEGFAILRSNPDQVVIPPKEWPSDGFPGLVEVRTNGGADLEEAFSKIYKGVLELTKNKTYSIDFGKFQHDFPAKEISVMRRDRTFAKEPVHIQNLYGRDPKNLKGKTLAALQINITDLRRSESEERDIVDGRIKTTYFPARYNQLDVGKIVRGLDKAFAEQIKAAGRQPGWYAIKDGYRLEYRSLPNTCWVHHFQEARDFCDKIREAVEG